MVAIPNIVNIAGLLIGIAFGAVGLLSGFCLTSGLRNWWTQGDGRLIRTFALALAVAIAGTQALAAAGLVDLGQSIYLQPSFSARPHPVRRPAVRLRHGGGECLRVARAGVCSAAAICARWSSSPSWR